MLKALLPAVLIVIAFCGPSHAELYYYTDEKGLIHITDDPSNVPEAQRRNVDAPGERGPRAKPDKTKSGAVHDASSGTGIRSVVDAQQEPSAVSPARSETAGDKNSQAVNAGSSKLSQKFQEEFKDVIAASSIPPEGGTASCKEFKEGLKKDIDKVFQTIKELGEAKKKGTLGFSDKLKGTWTLKSLAWFLYRHETGPKQCVQEFDKENEKRLTAEAKEVEALTAELKDK